MSSRIALSSGVTSLLIACSCSFVLDEMRLPNTALTFDNRSPVASIAAIVLSNVAGAASFAMASTSRRCRAMASL